MLLQITKKIGIFTIISGTVFFVPNIFVCRFYTFPVLWTITYLLFFMGILILSKNKIRIPMSSIIIIIVAGIVLLLSNRFILESLFGLLIFLALIILLFRNYVSAYSKLSNIYVIFTLLGCVIALHGIGQFLGILLTFSTTYKIVGTFDNPSGFAACLAALFPFTLYRIEFVKNRWKIFQIISASIIFISITLSFSRSAIVACIIVLILKFFRHTKFKSLFSFLKNPFRLLLGISCLFILVSGFYFLKKDSADGRLLIWRVSANIIADKPMIGSGVNSFGGIYMTNQAKYFANNPESRFSFLADNVKHPFNEILKLVIENRIVGLILVVFVVIIVIRESFKMKSNKKTPCYDSIIAIGICSCFTYPFSYPIIWVLSSCCIGIIVWNKVPPYIFILNKWPKLYL